MHPMLNIAIRAARQAGDIIIRSADSVDTLKITIKSPNDYATEIDQRAEEEIINTLLTAYPDHGVLAEESGSLNEDAEYIWIIDPLDGTTNFIHGFPHYAVSIALKKGDVIEQAVIYDPVRQDLFTATRGKGAMLNNRRIRVARQRKIEGAFLGTGFPFKNNKNIEPYLDIFRDIFSSTSGVRRAGAASLDLAYVAAGKLDGFFEIGLKPWDFAAGILLIQEAGGVVTDFSNNHDYFKTGNIICANPKMHAALLNKVEPHVDKVINS
ncbi:MAG: inositol monophosphatase [Cycloclasticus sp. symbiont of Bathymodiolus heckerae]|nr:MAG: inositol monophosphatase [Cycloclasticus sp. symbiont of Bathymodiolus heckerae]